MGWFFDHTVHQINGDYICTLRKMPESDGAVNRLVRGNKSFDVYKLACKPYTRRLYKSGRVVVVYLLSVLTDGHYEATTIGEDGKKCKHHFIILNGQVQTELNGFEEIVSETEAS